MSKLSDHDLTVLVEAAASGAVESRAAHHGGPGWEAMDSGDKNAVREHALPFIFHGTKALAGLGYRKPRTITTAEELDALPDAVLILTEQGGYWESIKRMDGKNWWKEPGSTSVVTSEDLTLPAAVLHEGTQS